MTKTAPASHNATFWLMVLLFAAVVVLLFQIAQTRDVAKENREIVCIGFIGNSANTASTTSADPRILELCAEVGVIPGPDN